MDENKNEGLNSEEFNNISSEDSGEFKKSRVLPIIVGILVGLVVLAGSFLVALFVFSPKYRFFNLVSSAFSGVSDTADEIQNGVFGRLFSIDTDSKLAIDINMAGKIDTDDAEIKEWVQNLESFELNTKENVDFANEYTDATAEFVLNGSKFLSGALIQNKNIISGKLDDVTEGYITVDNNNLTSLWEKIQYNGPESLSLQPDMLKDWSFSKEDMSGLKGAAKAFGNGFVSAFDDEDFSFGTGAVSYDEGVIECDSMDFVVDPVKLNNGLIYGLEKVMSKEKYVDGVYKVFSTLDKMSGYEPLTRDEFSTNLEMMLQEIQALEFSDTDESFIIRIYYKGSDILKVELLSEDYNTKIIEFTSVTNKTSGYYRFFDGMTVYEDKVTTIDNVTTHALTVDYINYETGEIDEGYGSEINIIINNVSDNEQSINFTEKVRLLSYDEDFESLDIMSIEPTVIRNYTLKGKVNGDYNDIEFVMIDSDRDFSSTFSINANITENAEFEYVTINEDENFIVTKKSDDEIISKKNKIIENWNLTVGSDSARVSQFESAVSMYLSMFVPVEEYYGAGEYGDIDWSAIDLEDIEGLE